jgi:hypothetical protein
MTLEPRNWIVSSMATLRFLGNVGLVVRQYLATTNKEHERPSKVPANVPSRSLGMKAQAFFTGAYRKPPTTTDYEHEYNINRPTVSLGERQLLICDYRSPKVEKS